MSGFNVFITSTDPGSVLTVGSITVSGDPLMPLLVSSIVLNSATTLEVVDSAQLTAQNNITLLARNGITIGVDSSEPTGVTITAGVVAPLLPPLLPDDILPAASVSQAGLVLIDTYQSGTSTGDIVIGDSVTITTYGGTLSAPLIPGDDPIKNPGYIGFQSGNDIIAGNDLTLTANGGNIWFNAANNILIDDGLTAISRGKAPDDGSNRHVAGSTIPNYTGGGVAFNAGKLDQDTNLLPNM